MNYTLWKEEDMNDDNTRKRQTDGRVERRKMYRKIWNPLRKEVEQRGDDEDRYRFACPVMREVSEGESAEVHHDG
jgi:hypothetical protein